MSILVVHPERALLERLGRTLRSAGIYSVRTCNLVAAVVYIRQLAPEVIIAGGCDAGRGYADLLARCQRGTHLRRPWRSLDLALLHLASAPAADLRRIEQALAPFDNDRYITSVM